MHAVNNNLDDRRGALLQVHVASFGTVSRTSTTAALDHWVSDAVALVPLLVMLILRTGECTLWRNAFSVQREFSANVSPHTLMKDHAYFSDPEAAVQNFGPCPERRQPTSGSNA